MRRQTSGHKRKQPSRVCSVPDVQGSNTVLARSGYRGATGSHFPSRSVKVSVKWTSVMLPGSAPSRTSLTSSACSLMARPPSGHEGYHPYSAVLHILWCRMFWSVVISASYPLSSAMSSRSPLERVSQPMRAAAPMGWSCRWYFRGAGVLRRNCWSQGVRTPLL